MNPFEMVIAIVAIVMVARIIMHRQKMWAQQQPTQAVDSADTIRLREDVKQLRERVQVLERVITDNRSGMDLDREIERLRDK